VISVLPAGADRAQVIGGVDDQRAGPRASQSDEGRLVSGRHKVRVGDPERGQFGEERAVEFGDVFLDRVPDAGTRREPDPDPGPADGLDGRGEAATADGPTGCRPVVSG
jgi:hypothetical protein